MSHLIVNGALYTIGAILGAAALAVACTLVLALIGLAFDLREQFRHHRTFGYWDYHCVGWRWLDRHWPGTHDPRTMIIRTVEAPHG